MKRFHKLIGIVLSLTIITLITGCGGSSSSSTGTATMNITDAPVDDENVKGVYIAFDAVHYKPADAEWVVEELNETRVINLLDLQEGNSTFLAQTELPAGRINQVRFIINEAESFIELVDEGNQSLTVPSGEEKIVGGFVVPAGGDINVTADFNVRKSLVLDAKGYKLKPTIRIIDNSQVGEINGTLSVDANNSTMIVYAYTDGTWDEATEVPDFPNAVTSADATDGSFVLPWLTAGTYDLVVAGHDNTGAFENIIGVVENVSVTADGTTPIDITLP